MEFLIASVCDMTCRTCFRLGSCVTRLRKMQRQRSRAQARFATLALFLCSVTMLIVSGPLNEEIVGDICICESTLTVHSGRIVRQLSMKALRELTYLGDRLGIGRERYEFSYTNVWGLPDALSIFSFHRPISQAGARC